MHSVIHVISSLSLGGAERFVVELAAVQNENGIDSQILSLGKEDDFLVETAQSSQIAVTILSSSLTRISRLRAAYNTLSKFDTIHIHSRGALFFLVILFPALASRTIVLTRHGLEPMRSLKNKILCQFMRPFVSTVTFVTEAGLEVFRANHKWPESRLKVVRNGILIPSADSVNKVDTGKVRLGSVGRMIELKGQKHLLSAIDDSMQSNNSNSLGSKISIDFFGAGPVENELKIQAKNIASMEINFHGQVSNLDSIYDSIDVLIVTSETEGLSMVIIEAMARAIPVIATNVGGNPTLVINNDTGILISYGNVDELRTAITDLAENPTLITKYGRSAQELVRKNFSIQATQRQYMECYKC